MLPRLSLASCKLFHVAGTCVHVSSRVHLYLLGKKQDFPREVATACVHMCRSEVIPAVQVG